MVLFVQITIEIPQLTLWPMSLFCGFADPQLLLWRRRSRSHSCNSSYSYLDKEEEISVYRNNLWIRSNFVGSDTMPVRHRADFKEALSTLRRLKNQEDQAYYQNWWQSSSSSWWNWQDSWWHPSSEYHRDDGTQH